MLVVENDAPTASSLAQGLRRHGHDVSWVDTGSRALQSYRRAGLVLLDLELPDLDGLEVCRKLRAASDIAVTAVTARGGELHRVPGLQAGADDYLVKPYGFRELMARMEAVMRRSQPRPQVEQVILDGPLHIDLRSRQVRLRDRRVDVTRKEFDLLHTLAS